MRSPCCAIAWQLGARYRWWLLGSGAYFLVVATLCQVLPGGAAFQVVRCCLVMPLMGAPIGLMIVFTLGAELDLASKETLFPRRMFTLPTATRALVGWPMLLGTIGTVSVSVAIRHFALRTVWPEMPLWWPAWLLAGCLAWLQALIWLPFGLPWLRLVACVVAVGGAIGVASAAGMANLPEVVLVVVFAAQVPVAYAVAVTGLSYARRGDGPNWEWLLEWIRGIGIRRAIHGRPFRSASHAQLWFEWRMYGRGLPILVGLGLPVPTVVILLHNYSSRLNELPVLLQPGILLALPLLVAMSAGPGFGGFISKAGGSAVSSFLATRPLSCAEFAVAKFKMAFLSVMAAYALVVPVTIGTIIWTEYYRELGDLMNRWMGSPSAWAMVAIGLVAFLSLLAVAWRLLVNNMFLGLTGRKWVMNVAVIGMFPLLYALIFLGWWISARPQYHEALVASAPWLLGLLVALKLLLARWALRTLYRRRLLESVAIVRLVGVWVLVVATLVALAEWLVPGGLLPWYVVCFSVVLVVPLARIGLAPLALAWNRHR